MKQISKNCNFHSGTKNKCKIKGINVPFIIVKKYNKPGINLTNDVKEVYAETHKAASFIKCEIYQIY